MIRTRPRGAQIPPIITCDNCGLTYYQTTAPHVCAEWTKGAEEKDVSTRLLVTECFRGNHAACSGYNGPADNPNFTCDCNCHHEHEPVARGEEGDDKWIDTLLDTVRHARDIDRVVAARLQIKHAINQHRSLLTERERLREALQQIAAFDDASADLILRKEGSYRGFDEPGAVQVAREALEGKGK